MNIAFVANPVTFRTVVYSTLGGGLAYLSAEGTPLFNFSVLNTIDTSTSSGFNELFQNGVTLSGETRLPVSVLGLPGHQLFGATYSTGDYVSLTQDPRLLIPGGNVPIARKDGSWSAYWNFDQYLVSDVNNPTDGWGVFGRAGISDGDPNLAKWFACFGVGGNSPLRQGDTFGVGWYRSGTSARLFSRLRNVLNVDDGQGVEVFYNAQVTPWFHLTPDVQVIDPGNGAVPTAFVVGFRGLMDF
jgi:porin